MPDIYQSNEVITFDDNAIVLDKALDSSIKSYEPKVYKNSEFNIFSILLSIVANSLNNHSDKIINSYDIQSATDTELYNIAKIFNIVSNIENYPIEQLRFLLKNFSKILDNKGIQNAVLMLFRVLERSEEDLYVNDEDSTYVSNEGSGNFKVVYDNRLTNVKLLNYLLPKIQVAGRHYGLSLSADSSEEDGEGYDVQAIIFIYNNYEVMSVRDDSSCLRDSRTMIRDTGVPVWEYYEQF